MEKFIKERLFENVMAEHGSLDGYHNYIGPDWSGWLGGPVMARDSDLVDVSNYWSALEMLGGEIDGVVETRRCDHWACGYFDQIMVNSKAIDKVKKLMEIYDSLEDYSLIDEDDYFDRVSAYQEERFDHYEDVFVSEILKYIGLNTSAGSLRLANYKRLSSIAWAIYLEDCGYWGHEDGFVTQESIERFLDSYECTADVVKLLTLKKGE